MNFTITDLPQGQKIKNIKIDISFVDGESKEITNENIPSETSSDSVSNGYSYDDMNYETTSISDEPKELEKTEELDDTMPVIPDIKDRKTKEIPKEMTIEEF